MAAEVRFKLRGLQGRARQDAADKTGRLLQAGERILEAAIKADTNNPTLVQRRKSLRYARTPLLIETGPDNWPTSFQEVRVIAREILEENRDTNSWNHGNAVYLSNVLLGRVALREGRLTEARSYLRAAGKSPGSPQLGSFGPELVVA